MKKRYIKCTYLYLCLCVYVCLSVRLVAEIMVRWTNRREWWRACGSVRRRCSSRCQCHCVNVTASVNSISRKKPSSISMLWWLTWWFAPFSFWATSLSISKDIFPGEPGLASFIEAKMMEVVLTTGAISRAKLQSERRHQQTITQLFTGWMLFLSPNQQCQSTEGEISHSNDLLAPSLPGGLPTFSLTTNSSWLPWRGLPCGASHQPSDACTHF